MNSQRERILVVEADDSSRQIVVDLLREAGYEVSAADPGAPFEEALAAGVDLLVLDADITALDCCDLLTRLKGSSATQDIRVILLVEGGAAERARALDLGADDVVSRPGEPGELLARVRAQLRERHRVLTLRERTGIAEEGQRVAQTAFQALAVTEKMTRDAFSLGRKLKIGVTAAGAVALVMAVIFFGFFHRAEKETSRAYAALAQLQSGLRTQEDLLERSRKMREELDQATASSIEQQRQELEKRAEELRARMASAESGEVTSLRRQVAETSERLRRLESDGKVAQGIIRSYAPSVCLLHVVVAFQHLPTGRRLRYAGMDPQGKPILDSEGDPVLDLEGRGPEVRLDFFGTGFLAGSGGRILTNRHVVQPWWKNNDFAAMAEQQLQPVISEISAYFPDWPRAFRVEIQKFSPDADLALVQGNLEGLKRPMPALDGGKDASVTGEPVVLLGYPTGLDAILARAGEDTVRSIVQTARGRPSEIMAELARRNLIRPISTQGHIGDVLTDKIVYDAQTTSGGSGGPLFNQRGKVIGVNFAVVRGFGGSNFGIPVRYAELLLAR